MRRRPEHLVNPFAQTSQQLLLAFRELNHVPLRLTLGNPRQALFKQHFPPGPRTFNREGWEHILNEHGGVLPVSVSRTSPPSQCNPYVSHPPLSCLVCALRRP